jgi:hypothetical protein
MLKQKSNKNVIIKSLGKRYEEQERAYNKNLRQMELFNKRNSVTRGSTQGEIIEKQRDNEREAFKTRINTLLIDKGMKENAFAEKMDRAVEDFQDQYREIKVDNANRVEKLERDFTEINRKERVADRRAKEQMQRDHEESVKRQTTELRTQMILNDKSAKKKLNSLKDNYTSNLEDIKTTNDNNFDKMRADMDKEKRELKEALGTQFSDQKREMRNMFIDRIDKMTQKYERRIADLEVQIDEVKVASHDQINSIMRKTQNEINNIKEHAQKDVKGQVDAARKMGEDKVRGLRKQMEDTQTRNLEKMAKLRLDQQRTLRDKEFSNQEKMKVMQDKYQDIIDQNAKFARREYERLKLANDLEKQNLITQYESQIRTLKEVQEKKMAEIEAFNRLHNS